MGKRGIHYLSSFSCVFIFYPLSRPNTFFTPSFVYFFRFLPSLHYFIFLCSFSRYMACEIIVLPLGRHNPVPVARTVAPDQIALDRLRSLGFILFSPIPFSSLCSRSRRHLKAATRRAVVVHVDVASQSPSLCSRS